MKTKLILLLLLIAFAQQTLKAQSLSKKIQKSVMEIGETFTTIPKDRLTHLDQVAFSIFKKLEDNKKVTIIFMDETNGTTSQLAEVWLRTGLAYYEHSNDFNVASVGMTNNNPSEIDISSLSKYGFKVRNINGATSQMFKVKYGSGTWELYSKKMESGQNDASTIKIYVGKNTSAKTEKNALKLTFTDNESIPKEMIFIATRLNNLLQP